MSTQTQGGDDLSSSIQQKINRIQELRAEADRLTREAEQEYFTPERLARFDERYRRMSFNDALLLVTQTHPAYDIEFDRCLGYCKKHSLYSFAPQTGEVRQPPMPADEKFGPAPVVDFESRKAAADRIRDAQIAKDSEQQKARGEILSDDEANDSLRKERLEKVAAQTAEFERRAEEANRITNGLAVHGSHHESRDHAPVVEVTREEVLARIAEENAELERRRKEAKKIESAHLAESELARQAKELSASLQRVERLATPSGTSNSSNSSTKL
jgi:hypothetical protein